MTIGRLQVVWWGKEYAPEKGVWEEFKALAREHSLPFRWPRYRWSLGPVEIRFW